MVISTITVILPVYNGELYLKEAISSVLCQTFQDFEFIICNDFSVDSSSEIINTFNDKRIKSIRNHQNMGLFATMNKMVEMANGKLIKLWSQDDVMLINCLEETIRFHDKYPEISFSYSDRFIIDENEKIVRENSLKNDSTPEYINRKLHDKIAFYTGSIAGNISNVTIRKDILKEVGLFDAQMTISADFDMWVKLTQNYDVGRICKPLVKLRDHKNQLSRASKYYILHMKEDMIVFNKLLQRSDTEMEKYGRYYLNWNKGPLYFSFLLSIIRRGEFKQMVPFVEEMKSYYNIPLTFLRWSALRIFGYRIMKPSSF